MPGEHDDARWRVNAGRFGGGKHLDERLVALEVSLQALDRLVRSERESNEKAIGQALASIQSQLESMVASRARYVERADVEKLDERFRALEKAHSDLTGAVVPRAELQLRLDSVATRQETITAAVQGLERVLTALRSELAGQESEADRRSDQASKTRNTIIAALGVAVAVITTIMLYTSSHRPAAPSTPTTPTTAVTR